MTNYRKGNDHIGRNFTEDQGIVDISEEAFWGNNIGKPVVGQTKEKSSLNNLNSITELNLDVDQLKVTSVEALRRPKHHYRIHFNDQYVDVHEDVMIKFRMMKGAVFSREELVVIVEADGEQRCYTDAISYLSRKPRASMEIRQRLLQKGWTESTVDSVIRKLTEERLIDDAVYAQEWVRQRIANRGKGKLWVRQELKQKGIAKPLIEEALGEITEETEIAIAMELGEKKWRTTSGEWVDRKRKTGAYLMRRGYSGAVVSKVLRKLGERENLAEETEEWWDGTE